MIKAPKEGSRKLRQNNGPNNGYQYSLREGAGVTLAECENHLGCFKSDY